MESKRSYVVLENPIFRVTATWIWFLVGAVITIVLILAVRGVGFSEAMQILGEERHLTVYIELVSVGLLPLILTIICGDDPDDYGLRTDGLGHSLVYSLIFVGVIYLVGYLMTGQIMSD